jgi:hypothetical protein
MEYWELLFCPNKNQPLMPTKQASTPPRNNLGVCAMEQAQSTAGQNKISNYINSLKAT